MRNRLAEKLKQARVQRAGPYAGGRARARSILEGAQEMFRTTDPNIAMMEVPHEKGHLMSVKNLVLFIKMMKCNLKE